MAVYFQLLLQKTIFLHILFSLVTCTESMTLSYNSSSSRPQCIETERQALLHFKETLTDSSGRLSSWVGQDCCEWAGVGCNKRTRNIVKLDLGTGFQEYPYTCANSQLSGKLNLSLLDLNHLNYLNLSCNFFDGSFPSFIGSLQKLKYLDLSHTNLDQIVPLQLGNLSNLHYLDLSRNYHLASDLNWLYGLTSLEYLNLGYVDLRKASASFPKAISFLPTLSELHLQSCSLEYPISPLSFSMENFTSLSIINLSDDTLIYEIPPWLINITSLVYLDLSSCNIMAPVSHLPWQNLHNLRYLDLSHNWFPASDLNWLSGLTSLEYLNLESTDLSKASASLPKSISFLPSLSELHLSESVLEYPISPSSFPIENFTSLSIIDLSHNDLISEIPPWLINVTNLVDLDLSLCKITAPVSHLPWYNLHNLKVLNLELNSITDDIATFIDVLSERSNSTLCDLNLGYNHFSGQLGESLGRLTSLTSLVISKNSISGGIPSSIGRLSFLKELDLSYNKMTDSIPVSLGELSSLTELHLYVNYWTGKLSEVHFQKLSKLKSLWISSSNGTLVFEMIPDWIPPFSLERVIIKGCLLGPAFPPWIQTQTELIEITMSNAQISETIPDWFWNLSIRQVISLDLPGNGISGVLPYSLEFHSPNISDGVRVDLSNNNLHGPVPLWSNLASLRLRNNSLSGPIPREIGKIMTSLFDLDLSSNCLNGTIPKSISTMESLQSLDISNNKLSGNMLNKWNSSSNLRYLDLSKNNLFGKIPQSICSSPNLYWLDLSDNNFVGAFPLSFQNCTRLEGLNLRGNRLVGNIPPWMGKSLESLKFLELQMNNLSGEIPQELCHLPSLHAIDLSHNNLTGTIPACFGNLSGMMAPASYDPYSYETMSFFVKGRLIAFVQSLSLLNIIDLSNNNLIGELPEEISNVSYLGFLNFSRNQLTGTIPKNIGRFRYLEALDLSHNHLSGPIPESMASLTFLNDLDLSFNDLSGPIPSSRQLSTINDKSIYEGNPGLCGDPLPNLCYTPGDGESNKGKFNKGKGRKKDIDDMFWYGVSIGLGFIMGFWGLVGSLVIKRSWRIAYFKCFHGVKDGLYVFVMVKIARFKQMIQRGGN